MPYLYGSEWTIFFCLCVWIPIARDDNGHGEPISGKEKVYAVDWRPKSTCASLCDTVGRLYTSTGTTAPPPKPQFMQRAGPT